MKAVRIHEFGGPEKLVYEDAPKPEVGIGELLVRVHAAGVNPVDYKIRQGHLQGWLNHPLPLILGWDVSGTVEAIGSGVSNFKIGDDVYSRPDIAHQGAYAQYIVIRAIEAAFKPPSLTHVQAAAVPLAGLTAWQALFDAGGLIAGQSVLIHAASGGVGSFAVQLARSVGARVIGTSSAANHDLVKSLGADEVIDYRTTRFEDVVKDVDLVFDTIGGETQARSWSVLKPGGRLVSIIDTPKEEDAKKQDATGYFVFVQPNAEQLGKLYDLIEQGKVKPLIDTVLPLSEARKAHELSEAGRTRGKIVLEVP